MKHLEIECKWEANTPQAFSRAKRALHKMGLQPAQRTLYIEDIYLDHPAGDLAAQKIALRVRNTDGKWEATYKTCTTLVRGKAVRREETLPLKQVHTWQQALGRLARRKHWQQIDTVGLAARFIILNKRNVLKFIYQGAQLEMSLDRVNICVAGRKIYMKEIEVELKRGSEKALDKFAQIFTAHTQLKNAQLSKVKTAQTFLALCEK